MKMTLSEAILRALELEKRVFTYVEVYDSIVKNKLFNFGEGKTPKGSVNSNLGSFIKKNDSRVKRIKAKQVYVYYLSKYESEIHNIESISDAEVASSSSGIKYKERDLHILLSSYLNNKDIYSKTIFHETSINKDEHQKWVHPDMVGIQFSKIDGDNARALLKVTNPSEAYKLTSYELKRTLNNDYELKKGYFQAVSNSSWANYGYLVAFEITSSLLDEIERLNQSFGIGVIELKANCFESKILVPSRPRALDFKTINKLCNINPAFNSLVRKIETVLTTQGEPLEVIKVIVNDLAEYCDKPFTTDTVIEHYCRDKNIPVEEED